MTQSSFVAGDATVSGMAAIGGDDGTMSFKVGPNGAKVDGLVLDATGAFGRVKGTVAAANTGAFNLSLGNQFTMTPTGAATLSFSNLAAGQSGNILLVNGANYTISKASNVKGLGALLATLSTTGRYWLSYSCMDGVNVDLTVAGPLV